MSVLGKLRVSYVIVLAILIPIVAALFFATQLVLRDSKTATSLENLAQLVELSVRMSNLVHEQQKERGETAVFLGSNGTKFARRLADQMRETDARRSEFNSFLIDFEHQSVDDKFLRDLDKLTTELAKIDSIRSSVHSKSITASKAIGYYTSLNAQNLDLIDHISSLSVDPRIVTTLNSYVSFLQAKERAGIERAVGANGFASGAFTPAALGKFKALITAQGVFTSIFLSKATEGQTQLFDKVMTSEGGTEVARMRAIAIAGGLEGRLGGSQASIGLKLSPTRSIV